MPIKRLLLIFLILNSWYNWAQVGSACCNNMNFGNGLNFWQAFEGSSQNCCPSQIIPNTSFQPFINTAPSSLTWITGLPNFNFSGIALGDTTPDASAVMIRREQCIQPSFCSLEVKYGFISNKAQNGPQSYFEWFIIDTSGASILTPDTIRLGFDYNTPNDTLIQANSDTLFFWGFNTDTVDLTPYNGQNLIHYARNIESPDSSTFSIGFISYECISCGGGLSCNISILNAGCNNDSTVEVGVGNFASYLWSNGDTTASTVYSLPLSQNIAVDVVDFTGALCSSVLNYTPTIVSADFQIVDSCYNDFRLESFSTSSPVSIYQHYWDIGNGFFNGSSYLLGTMTAPGNYTIQLAVQTENGCWDTISRVITLPQITIPAFQPPYVCGSDAYTLTTSNINANTEVRWVINGVNYGYVDSLSFQNSSPGVYDVQLIYNDLILSCSDTVQTSYTVYERANPFWNSLYPICENDGPFDLWNNVSCNIPVSVQFINSPYNDNQYFFPDLAGPGSHVVTGLVTTNFGCTDTVVGLIEVADKPDILSQGPVITCEDADPTSLLPYVNSNVPGFFSFIHPAVNGDLFYPTVAGVGSFLIDAIQVNVEFGCTDTIAIPVQVDPKPVVFVQPPQGICIQQGLWMPSDGTPSGGWTESYYLEDGVFNPASWGSGLYNFTYNYTDSLGCTGRFDYQIEVLEDDCFCTLYLPNTFSPNGDGKNETFGPKWECDLIDYKFEIWNRWGELLFTTTDPYEQWDGNEEVVDRKQDAYLFRLWYTGRYLNENLEWVNKEEYIQGEVFLLR